MVTHAQELMMTLLIRCGLQKTDAAILTLTLRTNENFAKMAKWLQEKQFKVSEQKMYNKAVDLSGYKNEINSEAPDEDVFPE